MGLFGSDDDTPQFTEPVDPNWVRTPEGGFLPFLSLDPEKLGLSGIGGVYLIWHAGVRPEWVYAGHTKDLAAAFHHLVAANTEVVEYEKNGGLFVAWALVKEEFRAGVVKYIQEQFKTLVPSNDFDSKAKPVPVIPPLAKR